MTPDPRNKMTIDGLPYADAMAIRRKEDAARRQREADAHAQWAAPIRATLSASHTRRDPDAVRAIAKSIGQLVKQYEERRASPPDLERAGMSMVAEAFAAGAFQSAEHMANRMTLAQSPHVISFVKLFKPDAAQGLNLSISGDWLRVAGECVLAEAANVKTSAGGDTSSSGDADGKPIKIGGLAESLEISPKTLGRRMGDTVTRGQGKHNKPLSDSELKAIYQLDSWKTSEKKALRLMLIERGLLSPDGEKLQARRRV